MNTLIYVKMDAQEDLLLSEGVCRQLEIVSYHPEVGGHVEKVAKSQSVVPTISEGQVTTARVSVWLIESVKVLPRQNVLAAVQLSPVTLVKGTVLIEASDLYARYNGVQLPDTLVVPDEGGVAKVMLSNLSSGTLQIDREESIGVATLADVVEPPDERVLSPLRDANHEGLPQVLQTRSIVEDGEVTLARKKKLRSLFSEEIGASALSESQVDAFLLLLEEYHDIFCLEDRDRGETSVVEVHIDIGEALPKAQPVRRIPFAVRQEVSKQLQEMQDDGIIQPSSSPWASPIVLVRKKDGGLRICVDYRMLNSVTKLDRFPLPRIDDLLDQLGQLQFFTMLDLASGFWQVSVDDQSREKTAFVTHCGLFEFRVMPFGLTNAPAVFQRLMQRVLEGANPEDSPDFVDVYIDDVLLFSHTAEDHIKHLRVVLAKLRRASLMLKPSKCHFIRKSIQYLGHVITPRGLLPKESQVDAVRHFPVPTDVSAVRQFLGLASYYRRFVKGFAKLASPLHYLTRKDVAFVMSARLHLTSSRMYFLEHRS